MIVADVDGGFQFVTQPAHARLAGQFADHWGSDRFDDLTPDAALRLAAYEHDAGWWAYDRHPHRDAEGKPVDFREMDADTWTALYDDGIDTVVDVDRYAGLLTSLHGSGLRRRRYGLSPSWPATPDAFRPFVEREEERQARLLEELLEGATTASRRTTSASFRRSTDPGALPRGRTVVSGGTTDCCRPSTNCRCRSA